MNPGSNKPSRGTRWCKTGIFLAILAAILTAVGAIGGRTGLLPTMPAFGAFGLGGLLFFVSIIANLVGLLISKGSAGDASAGKTIAALALGVVVIGTELAMRPDSSGAPPIHDLTTDTANPPEFIAVVPLRADAPNPPEYLDDGSAEKQTEAFPNLVTVIIDMPAPDVFAAAEQVVQELGWDLVAADLMDGRIEATETTTWFRFKDDVVIRIGSGEDNQTFVDVRSKSRVGQGDMGTNARRIRTFLAALADKTGG